MSLVLSEPGKVWRLALNRPEARNAVSPAVLGELVAALEAAGSDPECRVVILSGAGKDFCAGADVHDLIASRDGGNPAGFATAFEAALRAIEDHARPVIAAVHGAALGAGCQIASACDLVVAAEDARFGIPSARLGIVVNYENIERLVRSIGPKRAAEMLLSARTVTGVDAVEWGLANAAVEPGALEAAVDDLAGRIASLAPLSLTASKRGIVAVARSWSADSGGRGAFDASAAQALASHDLAEGLAAFRERRAPEFRGG